MSFFGNITNAKRTNRLPPLVDGYYPQLQVLRCEQFQGDPKVGAKVFYKATLRVLESGPGLSPVDTQTVFMEQLNGTYPDLALASISEFVGCCLGIMPEDTARRAAEVTAEVAQGSLLPTQPLAGSIICGHQITKVRAGTDAQGRPKPPIPTWMFRPLLDPATGRPKFAPLPPNLQIQASAPAASAPTSGFAPTNGGAYSPGAYGAPPAQPGFPGAAIPGYPAPAMGGAPGFAGPPPAGGPSFPPPTAPAFPPPGWLPAQPGYFYKPGMPNSITEAQLRQLIAAGQA